jgi:hypothetical protein
LEPHFTTVPAINLPGFRARAAGRDKETCETAAQRILFEGQEGAKFDLCSIDNL